MRKPVLLLDLGGVLADPGNPVTAMGLDMTTREFWSTWVDAPAVRGFETGQLQAKDFYSRVAAELAPLSNTNPVHWRQVTASTPVFSTFARLFLSYETGRFKPVAARALGIEAHCVSGFDELVRHMDGG